MARYWCSRCGKEQNTLSEPHLCKDLSKRLAKREAQAQAVFDIMDEAVGADGWERQPMDVARDIVKQLAGMGVESD